ncbi:MAG TPA: cupin domain-containing protein [Terriglobales bacterium]|jgi:mannose-6-phosphate isomerase-like protein (cupin superfamily)
MIVKLCCLLLPALMLASAQDTAPDGFQLWTGDSLTHMAQELKTQAAGDPHHIATRKLADFQNDLFMLAHREADGVAEWHETQADVFFVQSGSATLLVGGNMVGAETTEPHEKRNGRIEGGIRHKLSPGDVIRIPPRTPHQLLLDGSKEFTYFVIKIKGY